MPSNTPTYNQFTRPFAAGGNDSCILSNQDLGHAYALGEDHDNERSLDFSYATIGIVPQAMPQQADIPMTDDGDL